MTLPADPPGPGGGALHEPFYDHRVPPYACPACGTGVLLLKRDTLHIGEAAESRALADAVGPEIGVGQWCSSAVTRADAPRSPASARCRGRATRSSHGSQIR